ncbi:MAG: hypothetical protein ACI9U0_001254 [Flavobacteriales bacterium]|jgi:hypothetical protein
MTDDVCRVPQIIAIDNNNISVVDDVETKTFCSFKSLLMESVVPYQEIIENEAVIKYVISSAQKKLSSIRIKNSDAAGLIVALSVEHAVDIVDIIQRELNEEADIVSYKEDNPLEKIQQYKQGTKK